MDNARVLNVEEPPHAWVQQYLDFLEVEREPPGLAALTRLTRAHLSRVPFENVTSILRRAAIPDADRVPSLDPQKVLTNWTTRAGGGVCFEVATMTERLLRGLGYRAHAVLAQITFPGSHQAVLVALEGGRFLVDLGNGAPFFEPIPLTGTVEIRRAGLSNRFRPDEAHGWVQERWIDGAWSPFCRYDLQPSTAEAREAAFQRHHIRGESWVVDRLTLIRCQDDEAWILRDGRLTHSTGAGKTVESVDQPDSYERLAAEVFHLPALPIAAARAAVA
jgi:arylamine N-acetyltransferase